MNCPSCQKEIAPESFFCAFCNIFTTSPERGNKANLFARWVAWFLDPFIALALWLVPSAVVGGLVSQNIGVAMAFLFPILYCVWFLMLLRRGLTPGKKLLGLQVLNQQTGDIPGFGKMFLREIVGRFLSGLVFGLGYLWALFDKNGQAWHDKLAGTVVVRVRK
jgi:uncharacterized RDD family membrane protein YckC